MYGRTYVGVMWGSRESSTVTCIACGRSVARSSAREYDKEGDRWSRAGKEFEYLCKACHGDLCHQPREDLETLLARIEREAAAEKDDRVFGARASGGEELSMRRSGNLVMQDDATGSYWSQILAQAICGPRAGEFLRVVPSTVTTWGAFREREGAEVLLPPPHSGTV